jgi:hypothetical protein
MKKMIQESVCHPYTKTEGLLCFVTGLLVISTFGLPVFTKGNLLAVAIISAVLAIIAFCLENNIGAERCDALFFGGIVLIGFISATIIGEDGITTLAHITGGVGFVYGMYLIVISFTSEPPDSSDNLKKGVTLMYLSVLPVLLLNIIRHFF